MIDSNVCFLRLSVVCENRAQGYTVSAQLPAQAKVLGVIFTHFSQQSESPPIKLIYMAPKE